VLVAVIVHRADLADFPTNSNQLVQRRLIDQIAGVVLAIPADIRRQGLWRDSRMTKERKDLARAIEGSLWKFVQLRDKVLYGKLLRNGVRGHELTPAKSSLPRRHRDMEENESKLILLCGGW